MQPDIGKALAMLDAFASVGVRSFDVTITNVAGAKIEKGFRSNVTVSELRRTIARDLSTATEREENFIIRPRLGLVQLDDLDSAKVQRVEPHAFMILETSPGNFQAWLAVKELPKDKEAARDFARRLRKGAGADPTASGATRISGSLNFKTKYAPNFPCVELRQVNVGRVITQSSLDDAGVVARKEQPKPPRPAALRVSTNVQKKWPSYDVCVSRAPLTQGEDRPDISRADFTWCRTAIEWGWSTEATAARLMELSTKAIENGQRYAILTATRAADSVERRPYRLKSPPQPR